MILQETVNGLSTLLTDYTLSPAREKNNNSEELTNLKKENKNWMPIMP